MVAEFLLKVYLKHINNPIRIKFFHIFKISDHWTLDQREIAKKTISITMGISREEL